MIDDLKECLIYIGEEVKIRVQVPRRRVPESASRHCCSVHVSNGVGS